MPPWKTKSTSRVAQRSETKAAKQEGGRRIPGSGNGRQKGDYRTANFLTEAKDTEKASYSLTLATLKKIEGEAAMANGHVMPKMRITIQGYTVWVIREKDALAMGIGGG